MLSTNTPMVNTSHSAATGHRWRELQIAMRTVMGGRRAGTCGDAEGVDVTDM
jgi:hypothetical protein